MASDVIEKEDDGGRYRGFDIDDDESTGTSSPTMNNGSTENLLKSPTESHNEAIDGTTVSTEGSHEKALFEGTEKDLTAEIASLRLELEQQQEHLGEIVQSYDSEVNRLNDELNLYKDENLENSTKKRKRTSEKCDYQQTLSEDVHLLKEEVRKLTNVVKEKDKSIAMLQQQNKNLTAILHERESDLEDALTKINDENNDDLLQQVNRLDEQRVSNEAYVDHLKNLVKKQENELAVSKKQASTLQKELEKGERTEKTMNSPDLIKAIEKIMTEKIKDVHEKIDAVDKRIDEKLNQSKNQFSTSFADAVSKNVNEKVIENAISHAKNDERLQQNEWQKRERNMIIHGIDEIDSQTDDDFVHNFLVTVGASVVPESITRLGKTEDGKIRPLKMIMKSTEDKSQVMSRLVNLKNADDRYRKVSVRDDYSVEERLLIKQWSEKAAAKNLAEKTNEFKVRGNPKNGLRLVRVTKRTSIA